MNKSIVAHFVRKSTQFRASFIQNQILNHSDYKPIGVFKYESNQADGGFAHFDQNAIKILNLWENTTRRSRFLYKYPKLISNSDVSAIQNFLRRHQAKILHFHYGTDAGLYYPFLQKNEFPSVVSFYGYDCSGFPKRLWGYGKQYLKKRVFPFVTKVLAMSPDMKKDLIEIGCPEEKIIVHYYGTDVRQFCIKRNEARTGKAIRFLIISALVPQKGHLFLLQAFEKAYQRNKRISLTIVGDGPLYDKIKEFVRNHRMSEYVDLPGKVVYASRKHLEYLQNADVFIHPSVTDVNGDKEGIPGAIVEAMAAGLPVISTYHAGIPYIIKNKVTGLLVHEWDMEALTRAILALSENVDKRKEIGLAGQEYALKNLDLLDKEKELEEIYSSLIIEKI